MATIINDLQQTTPISLLPRPKVEDRVGIKTTKIYELMSDGKFPKPLRIGGRCLWPSTAIDSWINEQISSQSGDM